MSQSLTADVLEDLLEGQEIGARLLPASGCPAR